MTIVDVPCTIQEKECILKVETDPTWGEFEQIIQNSNNTGNTYSFFEEITKGIIKEGLPFDPKNRTQWKLIKLSEMTELVGKVMKVFPLGKYLDNLGIAENPTFKNLIQ